MSNYETMKASYEKVQKARKGLTSLVSDSKKLYLEDLRKVDKDSTLSTEGKYLKKNDIRKKYSDAFIKSVIEVKEERDRAAITARNRAQAILNEGPKKPHDDDVKSFDRQFKDLRMSLMLGTNAQKSLTQLQEFISNQSDPYFINSIVEEFPSLVGDILDTAGQDAPTFKIELQKVYNDSKDRSMSDEQKEANRVYELMGNELERNLFAQTEDGYGLELQAVRDTFGESVARYANKPNFYPIQSDENTEEQGAE